MSAHTHTLKLTAAVNIQLLDVKADQCRTTNVMYDVNDVQSCRHITHIRAVTMSTNIGHPVSTHPEAYTMTRSTHFKHMPSIL